MSWTSLKFGSRLPDGIRLNERDGLTWMTNFTSDQCEVDVPTEDIVAGERTLEPFDAIHFRNSTDSCDCPE